MVEGSPVTALTQVPIRPHPRLKAELFQPVEAHEVEAVLDCLRNQGTLVLKVPGFADEVAGFHEGRPRRSVSGEFRTDGALVWYAGTGDYLERYGDQVFAPFLEHVRAHNYRLAEPQLESVQAAAFAAIDRRPARRPEARGSAADGLAF